MATNTVGARMATHASIGTTGFTCAQELQGTPEPTTYNLSTAHPARALYRHTLRNAVHHDTAFHWLQKIARNINVNFTYLNNFKLQRRA